MTKALAKLRAYISEHDDVYGGLFYDEPSGQFVVTRAYSTDSLSVNDVLAKVSPGNSRTASSGSAKTIRLSSVTKSVARSTRTLVQIRDDLRAQRGAGGPLSSATYWAIDDAANTVIVGMEQDVTQGLVDQVRSVYGDAVELRKVPHFSYASLVTNLAGKSLRIVDLSGTGGAQPSPQGQVSAAAAAPNRLADDPAGYSSGDRLTFYDPSIGLGSCTAGWSYTSNNHMYTAGHCFPTGSSVYQGYF